MHFFSQVCPFFYIDSYPLSSTSAEHWHPHAVLLFHYSALAGKCGMCIDWLIDCMVLIPFSTVFQLYCMGQCTYPCFPGVLLTSTLHSILPKPLTTLPRHHLRNNGQQRERNELCLNDYHQSSERILGQPGGSN